MTYLPIIFSLLAVLDPNLPYLHGISYIVTPCLPESESKLPVWLREIESTSKTGGFVRDRV